MLHITFFFFIYELPHPSNSKIETILPVTQYSMYSKGKRLNMILYQSESVGGLFKIHLNMLLCAAYVDICSNLLL